MKFVFSLLFAVITYPVGVAAEQDPCRYLVAASSCQSLQPLLVERIQQSSLLNQVFSDSEQYQLQILYTRIEKPLKPNELPKLHYYHYRLNPTRYFYPASTVKLPIAALALQWLYEQNRPELTLATPMLTDSQRSPQTTAHTDETSESGLPSIGHYIKKILLVSDNDGSNRLYELLGQTYINEQLHAKGLSNTIINHRLSVPFSDDDNRYFNPVRFVDSKGQTLLVLPERQVAESYRNAEQPKLGKAYYQRGELIPKPMDFTFKNRQSLIDFDGVVKRIVMPQVFAERQRFNISESQRQFLLEHMRKLPRQSQYPTYPEAEYPDTYVKYFLKGDVQQRLPEYIHYHNKNGQAYGHVIDGAYIEDTKHGIAFFLTAILYTNANQILNDDTYETDTIGQPFLRELGTVLYQYELNQRQQAGDH
jgi:hypothetical protein